MVKCPESCYDCPLGENRDTEGGKIVWGQMPKHPKIALVGEAPGADESMSGAPFVGQAGQVLDSMLEEAGLKRKNLAILNVVKCRPPANRPPTSAESKACSKYLYAQIEAMRPKLLMPLGNIAMRQLLGKAGGITQLRGSLKEIEIRGHKYLVMPTMHPSYVMRNLRAHDTSARSLVISDFEKAKGIVSTKHKKVEHEYFLTSRLEHVEKMCLYLGGLPSFAFDTESTGLDPRISPLLGMSFSAEKYTGYYVPLMVPSELGTGLKRYWTKKGETQKVRSLLRDLMAKSPAKKIAHNMSYDLRVVWNQLKCPVKNAYFDTMIAAHLMDENSPVGLAGLSDRHFVDLVGYKTQVRQYAKGSTDGYASIPLENLWPYACGDADATYRLYRMFKRKFKDEPGLKRVFYLHSMPICLTLARMMDRGISLDQSQVLELRRYYTKEYAKLVKRIEKRAGFPVNPNGRKDMTQLVIQLGVNLPLTGSGVPSTAEGLLEEHVAQYPVLGDVLAARKVQKNLSTYVDGIASNLADDGKIHARFTQVFTVTGRLSCRDPNLQNIKKEKPLQNLFMAAPGMLLHYSDYSQMELRVLSWVAQEPEMLEAWSKGIDFHKLTASAIFQVPIDKVENDQRQIGKSFNFAIAYGAGPVGLSHTFKLPLEETLRFYDRYFKRFSALAKWHESTLEHCRKFGFVENPYGRRRRIPEINSVEKSVRTHAEHMAVNFPIQSGAWDLCGRNMALLEDFCKQEDDGAGVVLTVHDSIMVEIPKNKKKKYSRMIPHILTQSVKPVDVPLKVDTAVVQRWGEVKE